MSNRCSTLYALCSPLSAPPLPAPSPDSASRIAIIGGGISGLAAAHRLTELLPHARTVSLRSLQPPRRHSGHSRTRMAFSSSVPPTTFSPSRRQPSTLPPPRHRRPAAADRRYPPPRVRRQWRTVAADPRRLLPDVAAQAWATPRSPLLSWPGKLRLLAEPFVLAARFLSPGRTAGTAKMLVLRRKRRLLRPPPLGPRSLRATRPATRRRHLHRRPGTTQHGRHHARNFSPTNATTAASSAPHSACPGPAQSLRRTGHFSDQSAHRSPATHPPTPTRRDPTQHASGARYSLFAAPRNGMASLVNALAARLPPTQSTSTRR